MLNKQKKNVITSGEISQIYRVFLKKKETVSPRDFRNCKISRHKAFVDDGQLNKDVFNGFHSVNRHIWSSSEGFKQIKMFLSLTIFL